MNMIITITPNPVLDRTLTLPGIEFNAVLRAVDLRLDWGGKGFNISRTLKVLGAESVAMGFVGGVTGDILERGLKGLDIETDFVRIAGETRTNIVITETDNNQISAADKRQIKRHIKVNEAGPTISSAERTGFFARVRQRVSPGDICVMAGSLPPGLSASFYADLITLLNKIGAVSVLDASGEALRLGWLAGPTVIKPNALETGDILGKQVESVNEAVSAAKALHQNGVQIAAITMGLNGLVLAMDDDIVIVTPPPIVEANAVGAGDALAAGLIWALEQGLAPADVARWGVAAGTAAAAVDGVTSGTLDEIQDIYKSAVISR